MKQISLFAEENRLQKLSELGDCLERLKIIDWESFHPIIALALIRERKSNAGRPPFDCILLSKIRCRIEHVFAYMTMSMHGLSVRSIGIERAAFNIGLTNLVYNLCRYSFLRRKGAVVG